MTSTHSEVRESRWPTWAPDAGVPPEFSSVAPQAMVRPPNTASLLDHHAAVRAETLAVARPLGFDKQGQRVWRRLSYGDLTRRVHNIAHALGRAGVSPGDRAGVFIQDGIDFVSVVFALQRVGAVPVLIDPGMGVRALLHCVEEQRLRAFIGVGKAQLLRRVMSRPFRHVRVAVLTQGRFFPGTKRLDDLISALPASLRDQPYVAHEPAPDAPATIVYTSGSTGVPKGVIYTHEMMCAQTENVAAVGGFTSGETHVACFPGFALYALGIGMSVVFPEMDFSHPGKADPARVVEALDAFDAQSAFASPALWTVFAQYVSSKNVELPRVRALFASGAAVQPALLKRLLPSIPNGDVYTPYGATEALPVACIGGREVLRDTAGITSSGGGTCVGFPAPGIEVRIVRVSDDAIASWSDSLRVPRGAPGEIVVRGAAVTRVYDQRPTHTLRSKIVDADGSIWHRMGDIGYFDDKGRLWFCGRKNHRVDTPQGTLHSVPCEAVYEDDPRVQRAALAWLGARPKQEPVICIELAPKVKADKWLVQDLRRLGKLSPHTARIEHILFHPSFPVDRRHNAKIEREKLAVWAQKELA